MGGRKGTETTQEVNYSPEAKRILTRELELFGRQLLPQQDRLTRQIAQAQAPGQESPFAPGVNELLSLGSGATAKAGEQAGLPAEFTGNILQNLQGLGGDQEAALRQISAAISQNLQSLTDPRFAQFLRPDITSSTAPTGAQQAADIARTVLQIAGAAAAAG